MYSMATPTLAGAKEMLAYLNAKQNTEGRSPQKVVVTDLREEAVVYINNTPFVLRELNNPVETLKHIGISGAVVSHNCYAHQLILLMKCQIFKLPRFFTILQVENMEARLKEDIIHEIQQSGNRMLLHREEYNPVLKQAAVIGYWENIFINDVKTPAEVYAALKDEGFSVVYRRIPLTREREALASDVDSIQYCKDEYDSDLHKTCSYILIFIIYASIVHR